LYKKTNKKGYVFVLDVTIASIILLIGITLLFYAFSERDRTYYLTDQLSNDIVGVLAATNIQDLCKDVDTSSCSCDRYEKLNEIICDNDYLTEKKGDLLSLFSELIEKGSVDGKLVEETVHEIFVDKKVIDEKRYGFAIIYTSGSLSYPLEIYNTVKYENGP